MPCTEHHSSADIDVELDEGWVAGSQGYHTLEDGKGPQSFVEPGKGLGWSTGLLIAWALLELASMLHSTDEEQQLEDETWSIDCRTVQTGYYDER